MRIPDFPVSQFGGLNTAVKDRKALKAGIAVDAKNWLTGKYGDHITIHGDGDYVDQGIIGRSPCRAILRHDSLSHHPKARRLLRSRSHGRR
jgi:hypothetical protein